MFLDLDNTHYVSVEQVDPFKGEFELLAMQESIRNNLKGSVSVESAGGISTEGAGTWIADIFKKIVAWFKSIGKTKKETLEGATASSEEIMKRFSEIKEVNKEGVHKAAENSDIQKIILSKISEYENLTGEVGKSVDAMNIAWTFTKKAFDAVIKEKPITNQGTLINNHLRNRIHDKPFLPEGFYPENLSYEIETHGGEAVKFSWTANLKKSETKVNLNDQVSSELFFDKCKPTHQRLVALSERITAMIDTLTKAFDEYSAEINKKTEVKDSAGYKMAISGYNIVRSMLDVLSDVLANVLSAFNALTLRFVKEHGAK